MESIKHYSIRTHITAVLIYFTSKSLSLLHAAVDGQIYVPAMCNTTDGALHKLSVHRELNEYVRCSSDYRQDRTAHLFIAYGVQVKGKPISKQRLSNWLVECIKFAYDKHNLPKPMGLKATRPARWQSHMLTWLMCLLGFIGLRPSSTPTQSLAGEF